MPLYRYACPTCSTEFEVIRKFSDDGRERCPECKSELSIENRLVGNTSFKLSGTGWYKDGYSQGKNEYKFMEKSKEPK